MRERVRESVRERHTLYRQPPGSVRARNEGKVRGGREGERERGREAERDRERGTKEGRACDGVLVAATHSPATASRAPAPARP